MDTAPILSLSIEKFDLSMHAILLHKSNFDLNILKLGTVKKLKPTYLDGEEDHSFLDLEPKFLVSTGW